MRSKYLDLESETELAPLNGNNNNSVNKATNSKSKNSLRVIGIGSLILLACFSLLTSLLTSPLMLGTSKISMRSSASDGFDTFNRYIMQDFDINRPMSDFLAGIAGKMGVPTWAFFVNRGQGIASFGVKDKDGGIMKFDTAEKVYMNVQTQGFRTMLRGVRKGLFGVGGSEFSHQPFLTRGISEHSSNLHRDMAIGINELEIEEVDTDLALQTNVLYFTIPNDKFSGLVRKTTFTNLGSTHLELDVLDGLSRIIPVGPSLTELDTMGRTIEAYYRIYNLDESDYTVPFYHLSQHTGDEASVQLIANGAFATSFIEGREDEPLKMVVDPTIVFDQDSSTTTPGGFFGEGSSKWPTFEEFMSKEQSTVARTPCAFAAAQLNIPAGESVTIISIYGQAPDAETLRSDYIKTITKPGYVQNKRDEAEVLAHSITKLVNTSTADPVFDLYVQQDYLDNVLRGGLPLQLGKKDPKIYHIFSRIHGDLERDYNNFLIEPNYYSQGPGNFRDVNQNRRTDVSVTPYVKDFNIRTFLSLVQLDGYNPLTVASTNFKMDKKAAKEVMKLLKIPQGLEQTIEDLFTTAYRPGTLILALEAQGVTIPDDVDGFIDACIDSSIQDNAAVFAQNGFWSDHWSYTLDLADNFLSVYPDKEEWLMYDTEPVPSFCAPAVVRPRRARYSLVPDSDAKTPGTSTVHSLNAVSMWDDVDFPGERQDVFNYMNTLPSYMKDATNAANTWHLNKDGKVAGFTVIAKFAMLGIIKFSTLDPYGMGIEYEGGKPGWNDAMNGLPGLVGSGMPETYEMMRILKFVKKGIDTYGRDVVLPQEFYDFLLKQMEVLGKLEETDYELTDLFKFWDKSNDVREAFRDSINGYLSGNTSSIDAKTLSNYLDRMLKMTQKGVDRAVKIGNGLSPTYFRYEATKYDILDPVDPTLVPPAPTQVKVTEFKMHTLPYFLEGPVRYLKVVDKEEERKNVYQLAKSSNLYDKELEMFYVCESLDSMGQDVGRMKAFSPGWLENQSIWLHMSYKFYLELIRGKLFDEFYHEIVTGMAPFMSSDVYGRSPLEAASFIVSSAFPDKRLHGQGFLARLSGSTAEFMSMWLCMFSGPKPFVMNNDTKELTLKLEPALAGWLFKADGTASFNFLGTIHVTYHNPKKDDTWKTTITKSEITYTDGSVVKVDGAIISGSSAVDIRDGKVASLDLFY